MAIALATWLFGTSLRDMNTGALPDEDDQDLFRRMREGDRQPFDALVRKYRKQINSYLLARGQSASDADDLCQEVWLRVWSKQETFDGVSFRAWFYKILNNVLIDQIRRTARRGNNPGLEAVAEPSISDTSEERLQREEELAALRDCIKAVGGDFVDVLVRIKLHEEAVKDVAEDLGMTENNVHKQVFRAKKKLEDCMKKKLQ